MNNKSQTTEVVFILDRSGSMSGQESDIIGGFNSMLAKQRQNDYPARITTVLFNGQMKLLHDRLPIEEVPVMTEDDYHVGGSTALLDAIGLTTNHIQNIQIASVPEDRPTKTLVVIMTDGFENASRHYSHAVIKATISRLEEEKGWEFLFIGADIDNFAASRSIGVKNAKSYRFSKDTDSFVGGFDAVGSVMYCIADHDEKLKDEDWDALRAVFDSKKKKSH